MKNAAVTDDALLAARVKRLSVKCYNEGLEKARGRELTNAAKALKKSILYDKNNINARNLLGLVLFEKGRYGDAMHQWRLSLAIKSEDNIASEYLDKLMQSKRFLKRAEEIPKLYNEAIELMKNGNDDLAAIRLKRIMELNKKCVDAYILYILLLIRQERKAEAYSYTKRVFRLDSENPTAAKYISLVRSAKKEAGKPQRARLMINENFVLAPLAFVAGIICSAVVISVLVIPQIKTSSGIEYNTLNEKYKQSVADYNDMMDKNSENIKKLTDENENLKSKLFTSNEQEMQQKVSELSAVQSEFDEGNYEEAAEALLKIDTKGFNSEIQSRYDEMRKNILPRAAQEYYESGKSEMNKDNNERAVDYFDKCIKCTDEEDEVRYSAMYQLGKISDEAGDTEKAAEYFKTVAEKHPVQSIKNEAENYLENLN